MSAYRINTFSFADHERVQLMDMVRELILERRQFTVAFEAQGASLSTPQKMEETAPRAA